MKKINFLLAVLMTGFAGYGQMPSTVDSTFGNNGMAIISHSPYNHNMGGIAVTPGDSIFIGGYLIGNNDDIILSSADKNGVVDSKFGNSGSAIYDLDGGHDRIADIQLLQDGKILACGQAEGNGTNDILLARFNKDGSPDKAFGNKGFIKYHIAGHDYGAIIKVRKNRIYIGGSNFTGGSPEDQYILCLNMDGTLDISFGIGGIALIDIDNGSGDSFTDFEFLSDGSIIVAGRVSLGKYANATLTKLTKDGVIDSSFAVNGRYLSEEGVFTTHFTSVAINEHDEIFLSGYFVGENSDEVATLSKINSKTGMPDNFFASGNGKAKYNYTQANDDERFNIVRLLNNGKILVCGYYKKDKETQSMPFIALYESDGTMNTGFGTDGLYFIPLPQDYSFTSFYNISSQSDNRLIFAGTIWDINENRRKWVLMRMNNVLPQAVSMQLHDDDILLYPNPAENYVTIRHNSGNLPVSVSLLSTQGAFISKLVANSNGSYILPASLSTGLYYISIEVDAGYNVLRQIMINK